MKESTQTLCFLAAAVLAILIAVGSQPSDATYQVSDLIGRPLTKAFQPEEAKSMKILAFNEETATLSEFEVAEEDGVWSIPSQGGYPADAESQMAEAAAAVMDREILAIASQSAADHADFGVVEPSTNLTVGQTGVGKRVTLAKGDGTALVDLVIGKEVKDEPDQRYVRRANQDVVYVVELDDERLSTKFEDWIEDDLLDLSPWDIKQVRIKDYTAELIPRGFQLAVDWERRTDMTLRYDDAESEWVPEQLLVFDNQADDYTPFELNDLEELDDDKLRELKSALDDLRIVDVEQKPAGLSSDLKAGDDFLNNNESVLSLVRRGFAALQTPSGEAEILSSEGEVICSLKTGVEYVLRFGKLQVSEEAASGGEDAESEGDAEDSDSGVNRYLFVSVRLNEDLIEKPELEELPELPDDTEPAEEAPADETEDEATEGEEPIDGADEGDDADASGEASVDAGGLVDDVIAERERIEENNQRALDEYNEKLKAAEARVSELNARFGDWYYVMANEVYKKVRLSRGEIITAKEPEESEGDDADPSVSEFGAPGGAVPGLPDLGVSAAEPDAAEPDAPESDTAEPEASAAISTEETADETQSATEATKTPGADEAADAVTAE